MESTVPKANIMISGNTERNMEQESKALLPDQRELENFLTTFISSIPYGPPHAPIQQEIAEQFKVPIHSHHVRVCDEIN